ncbi:MAG: VanZ family protein, partial [Gemmatimonadetes bacterium]|nr:VanZ family protein [Gemmatimonadota bacterium]
MRALARAALFLVIGLILAATLLPTGTVRVEGGWVRCLVCGSRGTADVIANLLLFLPLGAALALLRGTGKQTFLFAAVLSTSIELAQEYVPGRQSSLPDVLLNTAGALLGVALARSAPRWIASGGRAAGRLSLAAAGAFAGTVALTGYLLAPSLPDTLYFGQGTARLAHLQPYLGSVSDARVGGERLTYTGGAWSARVRTALLADAPIVIRGVAGPLPPALAPIVSVHDQWEREIVLVGTAGGDLVFRRRTRAADARLDVPDLRAVDALRGVPAGAPLEIVVSGGGHCISVNDRRECGLGFTAGSGWGLLLYVDSLPAWMKALANAGWLALLALPLGLWLRRRPESLAGFATMAAALALLPAYAGLLATPPLEWLGAGAGLAAGLALHRLLAPRAA